MARRLLVTYLTITALALAIVIVPLGRIFADREENRLVFDVERDAQSVASLVEDALQTGGRPSIDAVLTRYARTGGRIVVVDRSGTSVADSGRAFPPPRDFATRPEIAAALDGRRTSGTRRSETLHKDLLYVAVPVASGGVVHGAVRITYPRSELDARVRSTWLRLAGLAAVVLAIVALVGLLLAREVSEPVRRLQRASRRVADGDLTVRVPVTDGPPELRALAVTFNATVERLDQLVSAQRRFVADASHQLRTPLTALRLRLETLSPYVADDGGAKLEAAIAETTRLGRLVESLLVLARSDAAVPERVVVDLHALVADRADAWRPVAADQDVDLVVDCPPGTFVSSVAGGVEQILDNLVSNALDVAPANSAVTIRVAPETGAAVLHVVDAGPGMGADARASAFERFWRAPGASGEGFGLGLAIVQQLAVASGGDVRLDDAPGGTGLDVAVGLPSAPDPTDARPHGDANPYPIVTAS
jgi:signal transduction histidine kinase